MKDGGRTSITLHRVSSYAKAAQYIDSKAIVIADEFDYQLVDKAFTDPFKLFYSEYRGLIALTATLPASSQSVLDQCFNKLIGFHHVIPRDV